MRATGDSRVPTDGLKIGELSRELEVPIWSLRRMADRGTIPSFRSDGGHRLFDLAQVRAAIGASTTQHGIVPARKPDWAQTVTLDGLDESAVWTRAVDSLGIERASEGTRVATYAFTEMLNNAIDHSGGGEARAEVWASDNEIAVRITDDGDGVFAHLQSGLGLAHVLDAAGELTKGKRTTWSERHSGEGIFFTSKVVDLFRISANGFRLTIDNERDDTALGTSKVSVGSVVELKLGLPPTRTLRSVFDAFTDDDQRFSKSRPTVKLFETGLAFISRSEARRVLNEMDTFKEIDIDFRGVEDVGQGFIDEALRVWPSQHPGVRVQPINMNEAVAFMAHRVSSD